MPPLISTSCVFIRRRYRRRLRRPTHGAGREGVVALVIPNVGHRRSQAPRVDGGTRISPLVAGFNHPASVPRALPIVVGRRRSRTPSHLVRRVVRDLPSGNVSSTDKCWGRWFGSSWPPTTDKH